MFSTSIRTRITVVIALMGALVAQLLGAGWAAVPAHAEAATTLRVAVSGAPSGSRPTVLLRLPSGRIRTLHRTTTISGAATGAYRISGKALQIRTGPRAGKYFMTTSSKRFSLTAGEHRTVATRFGRTTLVVAAKALPRGFDASIRVVGPAHFSRVYHGRRPLVLRGVQPGRYRATASKVVVRAAKPGARAGTYLPVTIAPIEVAAGSTGRLTADYTDIITGRVVKVAVRQVVATTIARASAPGVTGTLSLKKTLVVGDLAVLGVTGPTPDGLLVRITKRSKAVKGVTTYRAVVVPITDVIPRGSFEKTVSGDATLNSTTPGSATTIQGRRVRTLRASSNPFLKDFTCATGASMSMDAAITAEITAKVAGHWDGANSPKTSVTVSATATATAHAGASVTGAASCTLEETQIGPTVNLPTVTVWIGWVPLVLVQSMEFVTDGTATTQATLATSADATLSATASLTATRDSLTPSFNPPTFTPTVSPPSLTATGSATLELGAKLISKLYGVAGPYVSVKVGPKLDADTTANPWWHLDGHLKIGIGIKLLNIDKGKDDLIDASWPISDAGGALGGATTDGATGATALRRILSFGVSDDLDCSLSSVEDTDPEFYSNTACGTFASIDGTLYRPGRIPAGDKLDASAASTTWTPVSQTSVGSGTAGDPYSLTTVADAGTTGVRIAQNDRWAASGSSIAHTVRLVNSGSAAKTVRLTRAFDCYIGDDDTGTGELRLSGQLAGCLRSTTDGDVVTLRLQALTPGASVSEALFSDLWTQVAAQGALDNGCRCSDDIDNAVGVSWEVTVAAGSSVVLRSETSMTRPRS